MTSGRASATVSYGLGALLVAASLGEGGASPTGLLAVHAGVAALLAAAVLGVTGAPRRIARAPLAAALLFAAASVACAATAPYGFAAWLVVLEQGAFLAVAWIAARCGPELVARVAPAMAFGAAAQGTLALVQRFSAGEARPAGTLLNPNHLGAWLVAALALGLGAIGAAGTRARAVPFAVLAIPAVAGVVLCGSRGSVIAVAAAAATAVALLPLVRPRPARRWALVAASIAFVLLAAGGVAVRLRAGDPFLYHRVRIWTAALRAVAASPWTGTGPGQFAAASANLNFPLEDAPLRYERTFASPHSDLLRAAAEFGLPAAILAVTGLALAGLSIARRLRSGDLPPSAIGAVAALAGLLAQAAVDDLTDRPVLYLLFAALIGSLLSHEPTAAWRLPIAARGLALAALGLVLLVGDVAPYLAWRGLHGLPRGRLRDADRASLATAIRRNPLHPDGWLRWAEDRAGDGADWNPEVYALARESAERAVRLAPRDARYALGLARIEALACTTLFGDVATRERTARAYAHAQALARTDPFLPLEQGRFLLATGDPAGARRAAHRTLAVEPQAVPARLLLAAALLDQGGASAVRRARASLAEAEDIAARFRGRPPTTPYAATLLAVDPEWRRALRSRLEAATGAAPVDSGRTSP